MKDFKKESKFGFGLIFGALLGGVAAFFLSPKSGKENREMVQQKMQEFQKWLDEAKIKERVEKIYGEVSTDMVQFYGKVSKELSLKIEDVKKTVDEIDYDKYKKLIEEAIATAKKEVKTTSEEVEKLRAHLQNEWKHFSVRAEKEVKKDIEKAKKS